VSEQLNQINVTEMRAFVLNYPAAGEAELKCAELSVNAIGKVLVKTLFSGVSKGTESLVFHGLVPESEWETMRCPHQVGGFSFPISYGYCCVGEVLETGEGVTCVTKGDRVFVLHPHQDLFMVDANMCSVLPKQLSASRAVLSANMETALNGVWDAQIEGAENIAIIGAGVVGLLIGFVVRKRTGISPVIIDVDEGKRNIAEAFGLTFKTADVAAHENDQSMQRIFNTSASGAGLQLAIDMAAFEARIVEMSWYGSKEVSLKLGGSFHSKRLQIISSQVGHLAAPKRETHSYADRMAEVMMLLEDDTLDLLLEPAVDFEEMPKRVHDIFNEKSSALCQLVQYRSL